MNDALYSFDFAKDPVRLTSLSCLANMKQKPKEMVQTVCMASRDSPERGLGYYLLFVSHSHGEIQLRALQLMAMAIRRIADFDIFKASLYDI